MINLNYKKSLSFAMAALTAAFLLAGCKKDKAPTNSNGASNRLGFIITDNFNLSLFNDALNYTGVYPLLNTSQTITVLAPDDPSFTTAGYGTDVLIRGSNKDMLTQVLKYHIL